MPPMISRSTISTNLQRQTPAGSRSGERFRLTWQLGLFALIQRFRAIRTIKRGSSTSLIPAFGLWGVSASCSELLARGTGNLLASCIDQSKGAPGYDVLPRILRLRTRQSCRQQSKKAPEWEPFENRERVDKPGSVVGRPFISNARHRASQARNPNARKGGRMAFLFALAPDGVFQATLLPTRWCALTAPFQLFSRLRGGVYFSVALSVGSPRPAVSWHLALWSPDFPHAAQGGARSSGPLTVWYSTISEPKQGAS